MQLRVATVLMALQSRDLTWVPAWEAYLSCCVEIQLNCQLKIDWMLIFFGCGSSFYKDPSDKFRMTGTIIIGAGGHGKVVLDILQSGNQYRPVGFVDADPKLANTRVGGLPVFGAVHLLSRLMTQHRIGAAIIAIGDNRARASYARAVDEARLPLINAIHNRAVVSPSAVLGAQCDGCCKRRHLRRDKDRRFLHHQYRSHRGSRM